MGRQLTFGARHAPAGMACGPESFAQSVALCSAWADVEIGMQGDGWGRWGRSVPAILEKGVGACMAEQRLGIYDAN